MIEEKVSTGIKGLDRVLNGGIPKNFTVAVLGYCGTGKTTLGMQFIWEGLRREEKGIYISLEEPEESLIKAAASYGWDFLPFLKRGKLAIIRLDPTDMKGTVACIKSDFPNILKALCAQRVIIDPISLFEMMFKNLAEKRIRLFELSHLIRSSNATAIFISETRTDQPSASRDGLIEYCSDGVISLFYNQPQTLGPVNFLLRVVKMKRVNHSRDIHQYSITPRGIVVFG